MKTTIRPIALALLSAHVGHSALTMGGGAAGTAALIGCVLAIAVLSFLMGEQVCDWRYERRIQALHARKAREFAQSQRTR